MIDNSKTSIEVPIVENSTISVSTNNTDVQYLSLDVVTKKDIGNKQRN